MPSVYLCKALDICSGDNSVRVESMTKVKEEVDLMQQNQSMYHFEFLFTKEKVRMAL